MIHAGLAMAIAGAGRIALNSAIAIGFGKEVFAAYGDFISTITIAGGIAAAGPYGAVTLGIARKWAEKPGVLPRAYVRLLLVVTAVFLVLVLPAGYFVVPARTAGWLWLAVALIYTIYQIFRAFGYAVQRADLVTICEAAGALVPLGVVLLLLLGADTIGVEPLAGAYVLGPAIFLGAFVFVLRGKIALSGDAISDRERRLAIRESTIFAIGAGSSTAMQFLPTVLAVELDSTAAAAILFGALHATAPLLVLSRVYTTVMIPALASGADAAEGVGEHMNAMSAIFVPSTAIALGAAPWIALSLGIEIDAFTLGTAAMVGMVTLFQVWSTPAITVLSAKHREAVPALGSLGGLIVASSIWWAAAREQNAALLPVGLAAGAIVRSLIPAWIAAGRPSGSLDLRVLARAAIMVLMSLVVFACAIVPVESSLALGAALSLAGLAGVARELRRKRAL